MKDETPLPAIMFMTLVNLAIAGFFAIKLHPDLGPVASLVAFLPLVYVIRKRYLRRFSAERERVIREVESRGKHIKREAMEGCS